MSRRRQIAVFAGVVLFASMSCATVLLYRVDQIRPSASLEDIVYISSPKVLKRLSLGYEGLLADIYWTRAVQYFGSKHHDGARRFDLLAPLLEITTRLDPHLLVAYEYGANFLAPQPPNGAGMAQRAIEMEEYGIRNNPDEWRLYYNDGFIHYMECKDCTGAAQAFARGAREPDDTRFLA